MTAPAAHTCDCPCKSEGAHTCDCPCNRSDVAQSNHPKHQCWQFLSLHTKRVHTEILPAAHKMLPHGQATLVPHIPQHSLLSMNKAILKLHCGFNWSSMVHQGPWSKFKLS